MSVTFERQDEVGGRTVLALELVEEVTRSERLMQQLAIPEPQRDLVAAS